MLSIWHRGCYLNVQHEIPYETKNDSRKQTGGALYFVKWQTNSGICDFTIGSHHSCCLGSLLCDTGMSSSSRSAQESLGALCPPISLASALSARSISLLISEYSIAKSARPS